MDFSLSKEQLLIQKMARDFAEKYIEPVAEQIDRENKIPQDILEGLLMEVMMAMSWLWSSLDGFPGE